MRRLFLGGLLIAAVGCNQQTAVIAPPPSDQGALDSLVMAEKPAKTVGVRDALAMSDGEKIVVTGRTPGENVKPFNAALATFILMAPEDLDREEIKDEFECDDAATCPSCKKILDAHSVRVELVDPSGSPVSTTVEGYRGLKPGSTITVEGTVQKYGKDKKLTRIVATRFYPG